MIVKGLFIYLKWYLSKVLFILARTKKLIEIAISFQIKRVKTFHHRLLCQDAEKECIRLKY